MKGSIKVFILAIFVSGCLKKDVPPSIVSNDEYTTGYIKFTYKTPIASGSTTLKDTTVIFKDLDSIRFYNHELYYSATHSFRIIRQNFYLNESYVNLVFEKTNLDSLRFPYTYNSTDTPRVLMNYRVGNSSSLLYAASSGSTMFNPNLTIISYINSRLKGIFNGKLTGGNLQDTLRIYDGQFDVKIRR